MVVRRTKSGFTYREGPYTDDELFDFYQRFANGIVAFTSGARRPPEPETAPEERPAKARLNGE